MPEPDATLQGRLVGEGDWIAATQVCQLCLIDLTAVAELVELGVVSTRGDAPSEWMLPADSLPRLRVVGRLIRHLGVNVTGAALAIELLEAQRELEQRIRRLECLTYR